MRFPSKCCETSWYLRTNGVCCGPMGHCKGKDNVKKRASNRKKNDRLAVAKTKSATGK